MHNILGININGKKVQAFLVFFIWPCWKTLMVAINNQEKDGAAQNQKLFTRRREKTLPEIIYVTFMLSYVHEPPTELLQGAIQIKHSRKTMSSQHVSKRY